LRAVYQPRILNTGSGARRRENSRLDVESDKDKVERKPAAQAAQQRDSIVSPIIGEDQTEKKPEE